MRDEAELTSPSDGCDLIAWLDHLVACTSRATAPRHGTAAIDPASSDCSLFAIEQIETCGQAIKLLDMRNANSQPCNRTVIYHCFKYEMDDQLEITRLTISRDDQPEHAFPYGLVATSIAIVLVWFLTFWWT